MICRTNKLQNKCYLYILIIIIKKKKKTYYLFQKNVLAVINKKIKMYIHFPFSNFYFKSN